MKRNKQFCVLSVILASLIGVLVTNAQASPCRNNQWQPTFVHDLISPDGPYYVMRNGSFVSLGRSSEEWIDRACSLINKHGVRNRSGFTNCQSYTRIQCGCDDTSRSNSTCSRFLKYKGHQKPCEMFFCGYQLKTGQPAKSGDCANSHRLFIAGLLPNSKTSESELLSRLKLVALLLSTR